MKKFFSSRIVLATCLITTGAQLAGAEDVASDIKIKPLSILTQVDAGQVVKGYLISERIEDLIIQRTSAWIIQEVTVRERLDIKVGLGGMFWYATPGEAPGGGLAYRAPTRFGPGIGRADMTYRFGSDPKNSTVSLQAGYFPYKYNPDAKNLGEYLMRSGTYPGYLTTGGWNIISEAGFMMQGARLSISMLDGKIRSEFLLSIERDAPPLGDLTPAFVTAIDPVPGIELGAGVACNHCLSVKPSQTSPENPYDITSSEPSNAYIIENPNFVDSIAATDLSGGNPRYIYDNTRFYTYQGLKLMGRASIDPKAFIPMDFLAPQDLKMFAEIALLGVQNYPFFYEKRTERMPIMFGLNLPTRVAGYTVFDALSFQMEYYNSPNPNSVYYAYRYRVPVPEMVTTGNAKTVDPNLYDLDNPSMTRDNWKWSVYSKKTVYKGLNFYVQAASDHLRLPNFATSPEDYPITNRRNGKDWYYLVRFELGI